MIQTSRITLFDRLLNTVKNMFGTQIWPVSDGCRYNQLADNAIIRYAGSPIIVGISSSVEFFDPKDSVVLDGIPIRTYNNVDACGH